MHRSTYGHGHLQPSHSACVGENVTVWKGCLSGGDRFDGLTGAAAAPFPSPWCNVHTCVSACVWIVMCVVCDWHGTMGDAIIPRRTQPDAHRIWHCRASGVTGMWQGRAGPKWLLRLYYPAKTLDTPFPISPSWSQSPLALTNGSLIAPYLSFSVD